MKRKESELTVITRSKELCLYILAVTDKSPKKFRFTLVSRLQNYSIDVIEYLYMANYIPIGAQTTPSEIKERKDYQKKAMARLRLLAYMSMIARESMCITVKQHGVISDKIVETQRLLYAWSASDDKRVSRGKG